MLALYNEYSKDVKVTRKENKMLVNGISNYTPNRNAQSFGAIRITDPDIEKVCGLNKDDIKKLNTICPKKMDIDVYVDHDKSMSGKTVIFAKILKNDKSNLVNDIEVGYFGGLKNINKEHFIFALETIIKYFK